VAEPPGHPSSSHALATRPNLRTPVLPALARAFRWKRMLESGDFTTIAKLDEREGIAPSYMTRVLRLTLLAPDIVEAILEGTHGLDITLARVLDGALPSRVVPSDQRWLDFVRPLE